MAPEASQKKLQTTVVVYFNILISKELKCAIPLTLFVPGFWKHLIPGAGKIDR